MKFLGFIYMTAGLTLAILCLRAVHGQWDEFGLIALFTALPNALTALLAYVLIRRSTGNVGADLLLLVACYLIGIGGGAYFYFT